MQYVNLGKSGLQVSRICLGTMGFGSKQWRPWVLDEEESRPIIRRAIELGINFIDTADMYSAGVSEEVVGRTIREYASRDEIVLATKAYFPTGDGPNQRGLSRKHLLSAVEGSLKRLGTDYIDLFYIHRWNYSTPIEETMATLDGLVQSGKVRYLGASSMFAWQLARAQYLADMKGWTRFIAMQNHYNLIYREEEREMIPFCREEGVGLVPWSPVARGFLAGNRDRHGSGETLRAQTDAFAQGMYYADSDFQVLDALLALADERGLPPVQLALAWMLHKPGITSPVLGPTKLAHIEGAVAALDIELSPEEIERLEAPYIPHPILGHAPYGNDLFYRS